MRARERCGTLGTVGSPRAQNWGVVEEREGEAKSRHWLGQERRALRTPLSAPAGASTGGFSRSPCTPGS